MSKKTQILTHGLLSGEINGAGLQGALENGGFLGAWLSLLQSRDIEELLRSQTALGSIFSSAIALDSIFDIAGNDFAASNAVTALIVSDPETLIPIISNPEKLIYWTGNTGNRARLNSFVNTPGSCLVRYLITSGTNWSPPDGKLVTASVTLIGRGAKGASSSMSAGSPNYWTGGFGGPGGETRTVFLEDGLEGNYAVTVPSAGNTVFGAYSAAGAVDVPFQGYSPGAGIDSGTIFDLAVVDAPFQPASASKKGGNGGSYGGSSSGSNGDSGTGNGLTGSTGGAGGTNSASAQPGTGIGAGGGGGSNNRSGGGINANLIHYGSGGGGGSSIYTTGSGGMWPGGDGAPGVIIISGVLGAPKP